MKSPRFAIFVSCLCATPIVSTQPTSDCSKGCSTDSKTMGKPVCGVDGIFYLNRCLAYCQGVKVVGRGFCIHNPHSTAGLDESSVVTAQDMSRFVGDKFRLVAKRKPETFVAPQLSEDVIPSDESVAGPAVLTVLLSVRVTGDGLEYISEQQASALPHFPTGQPSRRGTDGDVFVPNSSRKKKRSLLVIGADTRTLVDNTTKFPWSALSEMDYGPLPNEGGCTGTLISRQAILTAGHCVYNVAAKSWTAHSRIAPGRYRNLMTNDTVEPFGTWDIDYSTTFVEYQENGTFRYDMAVVKYKPNTIAILSANCPYISLTCDSFSP